MDDAEARGREALAAELEALLAIIAKMAAKRQPTKRSAINEPPAAVVGLAAKHGLEDEQLVRVLRTMVSMQHTKMAARMAVLLVPRRACIERACVEVIVHALTNLAPNVRVALTKWLLVCRPYWSREAKQLLRDSYALWFGLVERGDREDLCRLLFMLTQRSDVTPWRGKIITQIMSRDVDPTIIALAELYAKFVPDSIKFPARFVATPVGRCPANACAMWLEQKNRRSLVNAGMSGISAKVRERLMTLMTRDTEDDASPSKRARLQGEAPANVKLAQLDGPADLAKMLATGARVGRGEVDPVRAPLARYLSFLTMPPDLAALVNEPLSDALLDYVELVQVLPSELEPLLFRDLQTWNGSDGRVLQLLSRLRPCRFAQLNALALGPLSRNFSTIPASSKFAVLSSLSLLLERWVSRRWSSDLTELAIAGSPKLQAHIERMCLAGLVLDRDEAVVALAGIRHLQSMHTAWSRRAFGLDFPLEAPMPELCTRLLLSPTVLGVSGAAGALAQLVPAFRAESRLASLASASRPQTAVTVRRSLEAFKTVVTDFASCLLLGRAEQSKAVAEVVSTALAQRYAGALSVSEGPVFASLRALCAEEHQVTDVDISILLHWLESRGLPGIVDFARQAAPAMLKRQDEEEEEEEAGGVP